MRKTHLLKSSILAAFTLGVGFMAHAQQDPYFTHYMFNKQLFNPATVGATGQWCLSGLSHYQYVGYEDRTPEFWNQSGNAQNSKVKNVGPKTQAFTISAPIMAGKKEKVNRGGIGFSVFNDKLGYELNTNFRLAGAYRFNMSNGGNLAVGVDVGMLQKGYNNTFYPLVPNDPNVPTPGQKSSKLTFSSGLYYQKFDSDNNGYYVGLSATNLLKQQYTYGPSGLAQVETATHMYLTAGMQKNNFLGNPLLSFMPSALIKRVKGVNQIDLTGLVEYKQTLSGGLAYRSLGDALSILLGYRFQKGSVAGLRVGYSYDLTMTRIINVSSGSHELALNYCFTIKTKEPVLIPILTPRFGKRNVNVE